MNHDALFKKLLMTPSILRGFFEVFLPSAAPFVDFDSLNFIDKEHTTVFGRPRTGDLLVRTRFRGEPAEFLLHLEHQAQKSSDLVQRMLEYFALDWRDSGLPVYPILVVSDREVVLDATPPIVMSFPNKRVLQFDFDVIDLPRMRAESFVRVPNPAALALSARMGFRMANRLDLIRDFLATLSSIPLGEAAAGAVVGFFFAYQPLRPWEALQLPEEVAKVESAEMRGRIMEWTNPWIEAGKLVGEADLVLRLLGRRFGALSDSEEGSIRTLSRERVEELAEALLDFTSRDDLDTWLHRNA